MTETLAAGDPVADFELKTTAGETMRTPDARADDLLFYAIYKRDCETCQYTVPYLERLHKEYAGKGFKVWGVVQESCEDAAEFAARFGLTFPQLVDADLDVTELHRPESVPTMYLVDSSSNVVRSVFGFQTEALNEIAALAAERTSKLYRPIVRPEDDAPLLKAG